MTLEKGLLIKWKGYRRNKYVWCFLLFNYVLLALIDRKGHFFLENRFLYIYRFISQQLYIMLTFVFFISIFFNERSMRAIENFMIIYIKDVRKELRLTGLIAILMNLAMLLFGQFLLFTVNFIYFSEVPLLLLSSNFIILSCEIITMIFFIFGIRLLFKKNIFVYSIYYIYILLSLVVNNVWLSTPLTARILGEAGENYYPALSTELLGSRLLLLGISLIVYYIGERKFLGEFR